MIHRPILAVLAACCALASWCGPAAADLHFVNRGKSNRIIIFLDGLKGEANKAFRWGQGVGSWPELMQGDAASELKQLPLERYDTAILSFAGVPDDHSTVPQLAIRALGDLKAEGVIGAYDSIVFIAHGPGGLVLKSMLVQSATSGAGALTPKTKVIFLISVPAQGRTAADFLAALASHQGLAINFGALDVSVFLQGLNSLWSEYLSGRGPTRRLEVFCRHETMPTYGLAVASGQYTTEGCDDSTEDTAADNQSIARPGSRDAAIYGWVRKHLADYFKRFPSDPGKPAMEEAALSAITSAGATAAAPLPPPPPPAPAPPAAPAPAVAVAAPAEAFSPAPVAPKPPAAAAAVVPPAPPVSAATDEPPPPRGGRSSPDWQAHPDVKPPRHGDWTFALRGADCNLVTQLWVVKIRDRKLGSETWDAKIGADGKFKIDTSTACATELVRGSVSGRHGSGWYLYADPCRALYCRARFSLNWRVPVPPDRH